MIQAIDTSSTFELAKYAAEQLRPLVDQLRGSSLEIDLHLNMPFFAKHGKEWSISATVQENVAIGKHGDCVAYAVLIDTSEAVDRAVMELREHLSRFKAAA